MEQWKKLILNLILKYTYEQILASRAEQVADQKEKDVIIDLVMNFLNNE